MNHVLRSKIFRLYVCGSNACFTRPEMKAERVSYDVITPSSARGILEAIFWKPALRWIIQRIDVLSPIRWENIRRNELGTVISVRTHQLFIEEHRQQRAALILKDVAYVIHAYFELTGKEPEGNTLQKLSAMFKRRARKGQCFHRPYLGTREFAVEDFHLIHHEENLPTPIQEDRDLGLMLYDMEFSAHPPYPLFFHAKMMQGTIAIPHPQSREVLR